MTKERDPLSAAEKGSRLNSQEQVGMEAEMKGTKEEIKTSGQALGCVVRPCSKSCISKDQDARNGAGNRVMNHCKDGQFRCTVCGDKSK